LSASGGASAQIISAKHQALPQVLEALRPLKAGGLAGPVRVDKGFAVLRVEGLRHPEDPAVREQAAEQALAAAKAAALRKHYTRLVARYAHVDEKLLDALDFEAKEPGFAALEKDGRELVAFSGGGKISVSDLAAELRRAFFHSVEGAAQAQRVNRLKADALDAIVSRRLIALEVARLKIADSAGYRTALAERRDQLLFSAFVQRAVLPDVKMTDADLMSWYQAHQSEHSYPAFYNLVSLAFTSHRAAQAALDQLRAGADLGWIKANAEGQVPADKRAIDLDGVPLSARALTPEVASAVAGAQTGDLRLLEQDGQHVVLLVQKFTPAAAQPFADARAAIEPKVRDELINKALDEWIARLRKAHAVQVFITRIVS
jgi:parvulin-like peptidyl-prolyl isomerase